MKEVWQLVMALAKAATKPMADGIKKQAETFPKLKRIMVKVAQSNNQFTYDVRRFTYGDAVKFKPLKDDEAVDNAIKLIGELVILGLAGAALNFQEGRKDLSRAAKSEAARLKLEDMLQRIEEIYEDMDETSDEIGELAGRDKELDEEIELLRKKLATHEQVAKDLRFDPRPGPAPPASS